MASYIQVLQSLARACWHHPMFGCHVPHGLPHGHRHLHHHPVAVRPHSNEKSGSQLGIVCSVVDIFECSQVGSVSGEGRRPRQELSSQGRFWSDNDKAIPN
jgi:hypothetical protein